MFTDHDEDNAAYKGHIVNSKARDTDPMNRIEVTGIDTKVVKADKLDTPDKSRIFRNLLGYFRHEIQVQAANRGEMARDEDFYDNDQWTDQERNILMRRGQQPLVFNVISTTINWMLGTQRRTRTDHKILPRRKEGAKDAERKTKIIKYIDDVNRSGFHVSRAFKDQIVAGVGWMEIGVQGEDAGEPIYNRHESWRNILNDSLATEMDNSDARYLFRTKWVDADMTTMLFPGERNADVIERAVSEHSSMFRGLDHQSDEHMDMQEELYDLYQVSEIADRVARDRVRLIECWFKLPTESHFLKGGQFSGELFDVRSNGHMREVEAKRASVVSKVRMRTHYAIFCEAGLLMLAPSPYRHNRFPFTPAWCYRKGRDNQPYGMVRAMRDPQSDINKRAAKSLQILSTNRTIMDDGAVRDMRRYKEEVARPDAIIVKKRGYDLQIQTDTNLAAAHMELMSRAVDMIQQIGGVTDENLGRKTNATSGKAITARQDQGALATAFIFDNLRLARQVHGEKKVSVIEQFMTDEREFRITNMRGSPEYVTINQMQPGPDDDPEKWEPSDITEFKADFIVEEDEFSATIRQAQVEELMNVIMMLAPSAPDIALNVLDLAIEMMDIPGRDEFVARVRKISGQKDPDEDENAEPTPEQMAEQEAEAAAQELQNRMMMLELAEKEAKVAETLAKAQKAGADVAKIEADIGRLLNEVKGSAIDVQIRALDAAERILSAPAIAAPADEILRSVEPPPPMPAPPAPVEQPPLQPQQEEMMP